MKCCVWAPVTTNANNNVVTNARIQTETGMEEIKGDFSQADF